MTQPIRIILIDDHRRIHQVIAEMIDFIDDMVLIAHGNNGAEAVELCDQYHPDIILMDIVMPVMDGIEATKVIHQKHPNIKILALSSFKEHDTVRTMLENGAAGYVLKDANVEDLENIIRTTYEGQGVLSSEIMQVLLQDSGKQKNFNLSRREHEVLKLFASGMNNGEIAQELSISSSTVKFHISNILNKLGVNTRAEALVIAEKYNLV